MAVAINGFDIAALIGYFVLVIGFGIWSSFKNRGSVKGYFLAGRSMHFIPVAASLYASNIGSMHFIGFAGSGAAGGTYVAGYEVYGPPLFIILGWIFLPVYIRAGVYTMPEYVKLRFGGERIGIYLSLLSLALYIFTKISADLYAGALFINLSLKFDLYLSIGILLFLSALFTIGGGLSSVIWTDFIQTIVMMIGAVYLMIVSFIKVNGIEGMKTKYGYAVASTVLFSNTTCGIPPKDYYDMIKPFESNFPWSGLLFGQLIAGTCQVMVQRVLAARNLDHAKAGCIGCGYIKLLSLFLMVMPGMISRILFKDAVACTDPAVCKEVCGNEGGCTNIAYPKLVMELLPTGARGVMLAVMMAALMSSLTSIFNSTSTIFTMDIWTRFRKNAKDWELMVVGRVCVLVLVVISILWIPILQASQGSQIFDYIQSVTSYLAPPVCAIYVQAVFFKRINEQGAFWGLMSGLVVGAIRFIWEQSYPQLICMKNMVDTRPAIISKIHYLHFGVILFTITILVSWGVSLITKPIPDKHLRRLTFFTKDDPEEPVPMPIHKRNGCCGCCKSSDSDNDNTKTKRSHENSAYENDAAKQETDFDNFNIGQAEIVPRTQVKIYKRIALWLCGIESSVYGDKTKKKADEDVKLSDSISENPIWVKINNINFVFQLCLCGFMWVFFNKYN